MRTLFGLLALALFATPPTQAATQERTWFVAQGFEFGHHAEVQAAVDAAGEGDLIVVRPGHYAPFTVAGKSLTIVAEAPRTVWFTALTGHAIEVRDLGASQSVVLRDLVALRGSNDTSATVRVANAAGEVRFEGLLAGHDAGWPGQRSLELEGSGDFTAVESGFAQGVLAVESTASFVDCRLQGAQGRDCSAIGLATAGSPGVEVIGGSVLVADSVVRGGDGGAGDLVVICCDATGGPGARLSGFGTTLTVRDSVVASGSTGGGLACAIGSPAYDVQSGLVLTESGATPTGGFASEWAQVTGTSAVTLRADTGQVQWIGFSLAPAQLPTPAALGDLLLAPPLLLVSNLGTSDGFTTGLTVPVPYVAPGLPPLDLFAQTLAVDPLDGPVLGVRDRIRIQDLATAIAGDADCNGNGVLDSYELFTGALRDDDRNGVPDACESHTVIHVDDNAPGDPGPFDTSVSDPLEDGSAQHPFDSLAEAIAAAPLSFAVIELAAGVYTGPDNRNLVLAGRRLVFRSAGVARIDVQAFGRAFHVTAGSEVVFEGLRFEKGDVGGATGGLLWIQDSTVALRDCRLSNGLAVHGGAIDAEDSTLLVQDTTFVGNYATDYGGAIRERVTPATSAAELVGRSVGLRVERGRFVSCAGDQFGGAVSSMGRVIGPSFRACVFTHNTSTHGGAVHVASAGARFESTHLGNNNCGGMGGAIFAEPSGGLYDGPVVVRQSTLRGNDAYASGGAIHALAAELRGSIVHGNTAGMAGFEQLGFGPDWSAGGAFAGALDTRELFVRDTLLEGGFAGLVPGAGTEVVWGPNNVDVDPQFASPFKHFCDLLPTSPAIDTGGATWAAPFGATDFEFDPRLRGAGYDRGSDEY